MKNLGIGTWVHRRRVKSANVPAVIDGDTTRTYAELAVRIDALAGGLDARGISRGDRVAFLGHNCVEFLETLFATATLGAIFVPLNVRLASNELEYAISDSGAAVLIHEDEFTPLVQHFAVPRVVVGSEYEELLAQRAGGHPDVEVSLDDPAAILYTSGTSGRPKGAVLTHGNLTWNTINVLVDYDVTSHEVALMVSPLFHVASLGMGALPTLLKGGTLVLQSKFDASAVLEAIEAHGITSLSGVPTTFQLLAEHPDFTTTDFSTLEKLTCGGSPVPSRVAAAFEARGLAFSSGYGMTESSPGATALAATHSIAKATTAGLAHFFTDVRIVDASGAEASAGTTGEITISGPNVMAGYWGMPVESREALESGWLHTGDIGFLDDDGFLTITDRAKDMIISGGENIYPAEVEQLIMQLAEVAAVAVIAVPDERWGEVGRAVVVAADGASIDHDFIVSHLDGRLARFKIPRSTVFVAELPRTASGKVQKQVLRDTYGRDAQA